MPSSPWSSSVCFILYRRQVRSVPGENDVDPDMHREHWTISTMSASRVQPHISSAECHPCWTPSRCLSCGVHVISVHRSYASGYFPTRLKERSIELAVIPHNQVHGTWPESLSSCNASAELVSIGLSVISSKHEIHAAKKCHKIVHLGHIGLVVPTQKLGDEAFVHVPTMANVRE